MKHFLTNCLYWIFSPILNAKHDGISLGRLLLLVATLAALSSAANHVPVFLALAGYVFADKAHIRASVLAVTGKFPLTKRAAERITGESSADPKESQSPSV